MSERSRSSSVGNGCAVVASILSSRVGSSDGSDGADAFDVGLDHRIIICTLQH